MEITTNPVSLSADKSAVYSFLSDFTNYQELMPGEISKWSAEPDHCEFTIQGMPGIGMSFKEKEGDHIKIGPYGKVPFDFNIDVICKDEAEGNLLFSLLFTAEVNAFYKMMLERPLTNFLQGIADKVSSKDW